MRSLERPQEPIRTVGTIMQCKALSSAALIKPVYVILLVGLMLIYVSWSNGRSLLIADARIQRDEHWRNFVTAVLLKAVWPAAGDLSAYVVRP